MGILTNMAKSRDVIFEPQMISDSDWQIRAHCPGAELQYITGFKSKAEIEEWKTSVRCQEWLKQRGYAK